MSMKFIACRLAGSIVREEILNGRRHFVIPAVGMVEGVHQGIIGPGQPGPRSYYSFDELQRGALSLSGQAATLYHPMTASELVSADSPEGQSFVIGRVFNVRAESRRLKADVWLDADRTPARLIEMLQSGVPIDVSLGVAADAITTSGTWNGEAYDEIVTNIRFDHLALLPGATGACSWQDGCGVRVNTTPESTAHISKETPMAKRVSFLGALFSARSGDTKEARVTALIKDDRTQFGEEDREQLMSLDDKALFFIANELSHDDISNQLWDFVNGLDSPEYYNYLKETFDGYFIYRTSRRNSMTGSTVTTRMYKRSFSVDETTEKVVVADDAMEVMEKTEYVPVEPTTANVTINQESAVKEQLIKDLIACDRTPFSEEDRPWLTGLSECQLKKFNADNFKPTVAPTAAAAAPAAPASEAPTAPTPSEPVKVKTVDEFLAGAPAEVAAPIRRMLEREAAAKGELIKKITANQGCPFTEAELKDKDFGELQKIAALANVKIDMTVDYSGQAGAPGAKPDNWGDYSVPDVPTEVATPKA